MSRSAYKPYEVICISIYVDELQSLDDVVTALHKAGQRRANRSSLIRAAIRLLNASDILVPPAEGSRVDRKHVPHPHHKRTPLREGAPA